MSRGGGELGRGGGGGRVVLMVVTQVVHSSCDLSQYKYCYAVAANIKEVGLVCALHEAMLVVCELIMRGDVMPHLTREVRPKDL